MFAGALAASCASTTNDEVPVEIDREVDVAGVTVTDIHFPTRPAENASGYPLVVMLHGGDGDPADMTPLAKRSQHVAPWSTSPRGPWFASAAAAPSSTLRTGNRSERSCAFCAPPVTRRPSTAPTRTI